MSLTIRSVDVRRPLPVVWAAWSDLERLPTVVRSLFDARKVDDRHMAMAARIAGESRAWTARITEMVEGDRIAWRSIDGPHHAGVVSFHAVDDDTTRVVVQLDWEPHGTFEMVGDRLGIVRRSIDADLRHFKEELEMSGRTTNGDGATRDGHSRLAQPDRGRQADTPTEIPARGWKDVLKRTFGQVKSDHVPILAAGVAFFGFLATVPALVALVTFYGIVADEDQIVSQVNDLTTLPTEVRGLLTAQLTDVTGRSETALGLGLVISIGFALWSASKGMKALIEAVNIAFDEDETRKFVKLRGLALLLTLGAVLMVAVSVGIIAVLPQLLDRFGTAGRVAISIARWPILFVAMMAALAVLYRLAPDRDDPKWRWATPGALVATVLWLIGSALFSIYTSNFGKFGETYGTLGAVVVVLLWLYLTSYIVLLGAELNAETERQTARDSTVGPDRPMGTRRAEAADELGQAVT